MAPERTAWGAAARQVRDGMGPGAALRHLLLWASRRHGVQSVVSTSPMTRGLVRRFVAGETAADALAVSRALLAAGMRVTLDRLGEDTRDPGDAAATVASLRRLIDALRDAGMAPGAEVSVKLSSLGQGVDDELCERSAREVCRAAAGAGMLVTLDMEDHRTTASTLRIGARLRAEMPDLGLVVQASLRRSEDDCRALAFPGSRVRLCKGAYQEPAALAWQQRAEVRAAYVRCLRILLDGGATPLLATHDPVLISASHRVVARHHGGGGHEHQMLYGIRPDEQERLVAAGEVVRVYVPFGTRWYPYLMRRLAERPANLALLLRSLGDRG